MDERHTAREIVKALRGRWHGDYGLALCPVHDDGKEPALSVRDSDVGDVVVHCFAGCPWQDVKRALEDRDLLPKWEPGQGGGDRRAGQRPPARPRQHNDDKWRSEAALALWRKAIPAPDTLVHNYLQSRDIDIPPPASIRYLSDAKHGPTGMILPAMIAAIQGPDRTVTGIQRTFLRADGRGKAPVSNPKMMLGRCSGGTVRLSAAGAVLAIAEGIETSLSIQQATGLPTWAALSTSGIRAVVLPPQVREVVILTCPHERYHFLS